MSRLLLLALLLSGCERVRLVDSPELPMCADYREPSAEVCDGIDNDCDGSKDEDLVRQCSTACGSGLEQCDLGQWVLCSAPQPRPEACNGLDDDCDGTVDNRESMPREWCYTGNADSLLFGECRPGVLACLGGRLSCVNETLPSPELCDGKDNDCDGDADEGLLTVDVVVILDDSGSMWNVLPSLRQDLALATRDYSESYRFALLWVTDTYDDGRVIVASYFTSAEHFSTAVLQQHQSGGWEANLDAVWLVSQPDNPLRLNWRGGSHRITLLFTDEEPQTYLPTPVTAAQAGLAAQMAGVAVHAWIAPQFAPGFSGVGQLHALSGHMYPEIVSALTAACR